MQVINNFKSIGFPVESLEQIEKFASELTKKSERIRGDKCTYLRYSTDDGLEIISQLDVNGKILGTRAFYSGKAKYSFLAQNTLPDSSGLQLDGALVVYPLNITNARQFLIHIPDFDCKASRMTFPVSCDIQISAFTQKLTVYNSVSEFSESRHRAMDPNGSFIPKESLTIDGEKTPPQPVVVISGTVKSVQLKTNPFTGREYWGLEVTVKNGSINVVCSKEAITDVPRVESIVVGTFFLSGRIVSSKRRSEMISGVDASLFSTMSLVREHYEKFLLTKQYHAIVEQSVPPPKKMLFFATLAMFTIIGIPLGLYLNSRAQKKRQANIKQEIATEVRFARVAVPIMCYTLKSLKAPFKLPNQRAILAIGSFDDIDDEKLLKLVERLRNATLAMGEKEIEFLNKISEIDTLVPDRRMQIPMTMTEGRSIYIFDVMLQSLKAVHNEPLPAISVCMATEGQRGKIRSVPEQIIKIISKASN